MSKTLQSSWIQTTTMTDNIVEEERSAHKVLQLSNQMYNRQNGQNLLHFISNPSPSPSNHYSSSSSSHDTNSHCNQNSSSLLLAAQCLLERAQEDLVANLKQMPTSFTSMGQGELEYSTLKQHGRIFDVEATGVGDAFWLQDIQNQANASDIEAEFEAFLIPYFSKILQNYGLVYVHSSRYPWGKQVLFCLIAVCFG